jgi:hypothetical protein
MKHCFAAVASVLLLATPAAAQTSKVTIVKDGKTVALTHAVAARIIKPEGQPEIRILWTSKPPQGLVLADPFGDDMAVREWLDANKASAVQVSFTEGEHQNFSLNTYFIGDSNYAGGGTSMGGETTGIFKKLDVSKDTIAGEVLHEPGTAKLTGTFSAKLETAPTPTRTTGAAVATSAQAKVLQSFAAAMSKMDFAAAAPHSAADVKQKFDEAKEAIGEDGIKEMMTERFANLKAMLAGPDVTLEESGDKSRIRIVKKDGSSTETTTFSFVRVGGEWKVSM